MAPIETSANKLCLPRKGSRLPSGRCAPRAANNRMCCRRDKKEGPKKTRATTSSAFWAAGNRRFGAFADSRFNSLREPEETQRPYHRILSMLTLMNQKQVNWIPLSVRYRQFLIASLAILRE